MSIICRICDTDFFWPSYHLQHQPGTLAVRYPGWLCTAACRRLSAMFCPAPPAPMLFHAPLEPGLGSSMARRVEPNQTTALHCMVHAYHPLSIPQARETLNGVGMVIILQGVLSGIFAFAPGPRIQRTAHSKSAYQHHNIIIPPI